MDCDGRRPRQRTRARPRQPTESELDHRDNVDGQNTTGDNLQALCRRHHHLKTETDWQVQRSYDGTTVWTSPTGRTYEKPPDDLPGYDDTWRDEPPEPEPQDDPDPP